MKKSPGTGKFGNKPKQRSFAFSSPRMRKIAPYLLYGLITLLVTVLYLDNHRIFATWELAVQDTMISLGREADSPPEVILVNIDDTAIEKLGAWPWDSERIGYLVGMLGKYEPKAIGLDLELPTDLLDDPVGNRFLAEMIAQAGHVVLPLQFTLAPAGSWAAPVPDYIARSSIVTFDDARQLLDHPYLPSSGLKHPYQEACEAAWSTGHINSWQDVDGGLRRDPLVVQHGGQYFPSMALQLARAAMGVHRTQVKIDPGVAISFPTKTIPTDEGGFFLIDFRGPAGTIQALSAASILEGDADPASIAGKVVVVGVSASGYGTSLLTGSAGSMPRTEKIATVTANILADRYITTLTFSSVLDIVLLFGIGLLCAAVLPRITLVNRVIFLVMMAFVMVNLNFVLYNSFNLIAKTLFPTLEILLFLAFSPVIKLRRDEIDAITGDHTVPEDMRKSKSASPAPAPKPSTPAAGTPVPNGPVRRIKDGTPVGAISGLEKTMVIDLAAAKALAQTQVISTGFNDHAIDPTHVTPKTGNVPVDAQSMSQTQSISTETPVPHASELMGESPRPMGFDTTKSSANGSTPVSGSLPEMTQLGRYEIMGILGEGAMGTVYKGKDPAIDRLVALKTIRAGTGNTEQAAELRERLVREAKAAGQLSHPHIVTIYDVGVEGDLNYIAMEFLEGYTLEEIVKKEVQLNFRIAAKMLMQICDALDYAHAAGIVHRDVKPANIMVLDNFEIKVMDFGIARFDSPQMSMTQTGIAIGTPQYIAPELLRGEAIDRRADIFSLGVVAYELLTQRRPFIGDNISQLIYAITQKEPEPPSSLDNSIPRLFDMIIGKALAKDPRERYQTAREMSNALKSFVEDLAGSKSFQI